MRKILFRGKRIDNDEWVTGTPFIEANCCKMITAVALHPDFVDEGNVYFSEGFPVRQETVGQYTGVTDRNGKKIFEWDIVKRGGRIWVIEYDVKCAQFVMKTFTERGVFWIRAFDLIPAEWCEVIGNKFDNPELIKGGEKNGKNDVKGRTRQERNNYK